MTCPRQKILLFICLSLYGALSGAEPVTEPHTSHHTTSNDNQRFLQLENRIRKLEQQLQYQNRNWTDRVSWSGYLSAGLSTSNRDRSYDDIDQDLTTHARSKIGLQAEFHIDDNINAVIQVLSKGQEQDWELQTEWAYLSWQLNPRTKLRVGRLRIPAFLYSDVLEVGYAYPWTRPPRDAYFAVNFKNYDGADLAYQFPLGQWAVEATLHYGNNDSSTEQWQLEFQDIIEAGLKFEYQGWRLQGIYGQTNATLDWPDIPITVNPKATFASLGFSYDNGGLMLITEYTRREVDAAVISDIDGYYVTLGYHLGSYLPFISYSHARTQDDDSRPTHPEDEALLALLNGDDSLLVDNALATIFNSRESTYAAGIRKDFNQRISVTLEVWYLTDFEGTDGWFVEEYNDFGQPVPIEFASATIWNLTLDAVF